MQKEEGLHAAFRGRVNRSKMLGGRRSGAKYDPRLGT